VRALHLHLPVHPSTPGHVRRQLRRWLRQVGWPGEHAEDLVLAVDEAVSNAVEHAYTTPDRGQAPPEQPPRVELCVADRTAADASHRAVVTVTDHGRWRPRVVASGSRGRGLQLMRALTESVDVTVTGAGTRVKMISRAVRFSGSRARDAARRLGDVGAMLLLARWAPGFC
jgi:anti-sigma regulatory factor (Ser/Thr protein kinase)